MQIFGRSVPLMRDSDRRDTKDSAQHYINWKPMSQRLISLLTSQTANRSVQPFCTAHGRVSLGMPGHVLCP